MRKLCAFIFLFGTLQYCISCTKEYSNEQPFQSDSLVLVKTARAVNYDTSDVFVMEERQTFTYDKSLRRTVAEMTDSGKNVPGQVQHWTETFQYDTQDRLTQFTSTSASQPATRVDFSYDAGGNILKAAIQDQWLGQTVNCFFTNKSQNGQQLITMYDTSDNYVSNTDTRPQVTYYTFDANARLTHETVLYTVFKRPQNWFEDTTDIQFSYDNNSYLDKQVINYAYRFSQVSPVTDYTQDSTRFIREGSNLALRNSFMYIYKNMYWFSISENPEGFANALSMGMRSYLGPAIKTTEYWRNYPPNPFITEHALGTFQNTFDADGLLTNAVYPKRFANKYGGKTALFYTYTKIRN